jgi:hypothetical protein
MPMNDKLRRRGREELRSALEAGKMEPDHEVSP